MIARPTISTRTRPRLLAGLATSVANLFSHRPARAADAPDIVVMLLNDARDGDEIALPQTMARLGDGGTSFPNFFLTTPLCCPSRASIFTGLYAHNTGVYENSNSRNGGWSGFAKRGNRDRTTGVFLQEAGYRTVAIGGYLNDEQPGHGMEPGWDDGPIGKGNGNGKKRRKKGHGHKRKRHGKIHKDDKKSKNNKQKNTGSGSSDRQRADAAVAELERAPLEQPLYLHIGFSAPHVPANPVPPYAGQFDGAEVDRDDLSFDEPDMADKPRYLRSLGRLSGSEEAWLDRLHQRRLEVLLALDDQIVKIWDAIEARGRLDNTYVFLLTDNGYLLGQHRFYGKHVPYDGSARMPLYAFGPGFSAGAVDERLVGNVDIAPTLVDVAEASAPTMDGVSLLSSHDRDAILLEFLAQNVNSMKWPGPRTEIARYRALRTSLHLYVEYLDGSRELYDYESDPYETQNMLAGTPSQEVNDLAASLKARLGQLRTCRGPACL